MKSAFNLSIPVFVLSVGILSLDTTPARADCSSGFLANLACETGIIDKQTANDLDAAHAAAGRPLDHAANQAAGAAADYFVPGSGAAVRQGLELRDQYNRGAFGPPQGVGGPSPGFGGPPPTVYGNFCATPGGRFGPGPMQPVGSPCFSSGPFGNFSGVVVR